MSAPSKTQKVQLVKIQPTQRIASGVELNLIQQEATNAVKLKGRTKQTATQVKELSSVICNVIEADMFHQMEGSKCDSVKGELSSLYRSLRPWYALRWNFCELGRSLLFQQWYDGTSCNRQGLLDDNREVGLVNRVLGVWESHAQGEVTSKKVPDWEKAIG